MSLPPILNRALNAAYEGANEIIHFSKRIDNLEVIKKEGNDLTTNLDQIVESKVFDSLKTHYPDFDYYGEETNVKNIDANKSTWVLDPIDGTRNFVYQYPHFALSLACFSEGRVICAVIIDPSRDDVFCSGDGTGSLLNNKRIRVSNAKTLQHSMLSNVGHSSDKQNYTYDIKKTFENMYPYNLTLRRSGCTSLDLAYVASGKLDGFWGHGLKPWDRMAGQFIAQNAGGLVSSFDGIPDSYDEDHLIVATPKCFKDLSICVKAGYQSKE